MHDLLCDITDRRTQHTTTRQHTHRLPFASHLSCFAHAPSQKQTFTCLGTVAGTTSDARLLPLLLPAPASDAQLLLLPELLLLPRALVLLLLPQLTHTCVVVAPHTDLHNAASHNNTPTALPVPGTGGSPTCPPLHTHHHKTHPHLVRTVDATAFDAHTLLLLLLHAPASDTQAQLLREMLLLPPVLQPLLLMLQLTKTCVAAMTSQTDLHSTPSHNSTPTALPFASHLSSLTHAPSPKKPSLGWLL
jgi:hypothetical protein